MKSMIVSSMFAVAILSSACGSPTSPSDGGVQIGAPVFTDHTAYPGYKTYGPSDWVPTTDGRPENPNTPPNECDCGPGTVPEYNGHNWVCQSKSSTDRVLPVKNSTCNVEHVR